MAGWLLPIFAPALVTLPSSSSARSATMRLRSVPPRDMLARPPLAAINPGVTRPWSQTNPRLVMVLLGHCHFLIQNVRILGGRRADLALRHTATTLSAGGRHHGGAGRRAGR